MAGIILWGALSAGVGFLAQEQGRSPYLWGIIAFVVSPLFGSLALLAVNALQGTPPRSP
mgnify:CR=1